MRAHAGPCGPMLGPCGPMRAHAGPCGPMPSPCQAHAKPMPSPCQAHAGRTGEVAEWRRRARVAACAWFLDRNLLTPMLGADRHLLLCCCPAAAALLLPCSFNYLEGVQGPPAPLLLLAPLLLSPLLLPSFLLAPLLLPPLLLPPLLLSPLALPTLLLHATTPSSRSVAASPCQQQKQRAFASRMHVAPRVFVVASKHLGGVWDLRAENKRPVPQNGDEEKDVPDKR